MLILDNGQRVTTALIASVFLPLPTFVRALDKGNSIFLILLPDLLSVTKNGCPYLADCFFFLLVLVALQYFNIMSRNLFKWAFSVRFFI